MGKYFQDVRYVKAAIHDFSTQAKPRIIFPLRHQHNQVVKELRYNDDTSGNNQYILTLVWRLAWNIT